MLRADGLVAFRREFADAALPDFRSARRAHPRAAQGHLLRRHDVIWQSPRRSDSRQIALRARRLVGRACSPRSRRAVCSRRPHRRRGPALSAAQPSAQASSRCPASRSTTSSAVPGFPARRTKATRRMPASSSPRRASSSSTRLGTPSLGWDLLQQIRKITDQPVRYIVVSHYHADHIYGLQAFKDHSPASSSRRSARANTGSNEETADERADQRLDQRRAGALPMGRPQHARCAARHHLPATRDAQSRRQALRADLCRARRIRRAT